MYYEYYFNCYRLYESCNDVAYILTYSYIYTRFHHLLPVISPPCTRPGPDWCMVDQAVVPESCSIHECSCRPGHGDMHVADLGNHRVTMYSGTGRSIKSYGSETSDDRGLSRPCGVTIDGQGHIIVTDDNHTVSIYTRDGKLKKRFGKEGGGRGEFNYPQGVVADNAGLLYIADSDNSRVQVCNMAGECVRMIGDKDPGRPQRPRDVALDGDGDVYVTDTKAKQVNIYTASGQYKSSITTADIPQHDWWPCYIAVDGDRQLYVTDHINHCVHVLKDGRHIQQIGSYGDSEGCFNVPTGIALSRDGDIIVCDNGNRRIQGYGQQ